MKEKIKKYFSIPIVIILFAIFSIDFGIKDIFHLQHNDAIRMIESTINNFVTLFGIFIAIGAILFSIIQSRKEDEDIISILFEESYIFPFVWFSVFSVFILVMINLTSKHDLLLHGLLERYAILGNLLFVLNLFFVGLILTRIYRLLNTELLFDRYIERLEEYFSDPEREKNKDEFQKTLYKFEGRVKSALFEKDFNTDNNKNNKSVKLFKVYYKVLITNSKSSLFMSHRIQLFNLYSNLAENEMYYSLSLIYQHIYKLSQISFCTKLTDQLRLFINMYSEVYRIIGSKKLNSEQSIGQITTHLLSLIFDEYIKPFNQDHSKNGKVYLNELVNVVLLSFSDLLEAQIKYCDYKSFEITMDAIKQIEGFHPDVGSYYQDKILLSTISITSETRKRIQEIKENLLVNNFLINQIFYMKFGLRSWLLNKYFQEKLPKEKMLELLDMIEMEMEDEWDVIKLLMCFQNHEKFFHWSQWYSQISEASPPVKSEVWIMNGLILELIMNKELIKDLNKDICWIDFDEKAVLSSMAQGISFLKNKKDMAIELVNISDQEYQSLIDSIDKIRITRLRSVIKRTKKQIAEAPISSSLVEEFKQEKGNQWVSVNIENLFEYYKNIESFSDAASDKRINKIDFYHRSKKEFFMKAFQQNPLKFLNYGSKIAELTNENFFEIMKTNENLNQTYGTNKLLSALDDSIEILSHNEFTPNIIFCYRSLLLKNDEPDKRMRLKIQQKQNIADYGFWFIGSFKDIPIFQSRAPLQRNTVVVASFNDFIKMKDRRSKNWFNEKLLIEVNQINKQAAENEFHIDPEKYLEIDSVKVDEETAIANIQNDVVIKFVREVEFEIQNSNAAVYSEIMFG